MKVGPKKIKAKFKDQLTRDTFQAAGLGCYAWIERLLHHVVSGQT